MASIERSKQKVPTEHGYRKERKFKVDSKRVTVERTSKKVASATGKHVEKTRTYDRRKRS